MIEDYRQSTRIEQIMIVVAAQMKMEEIEAVKFVGGSSFNSM